MACEVDIVKYRADSRFAPSQWESALLCNDVSHWLGASIELPLKYIRSQAATCTYNYNIHRVSIIYSCKIQGRKNMAIPFVLSIILRIFKTRSYIAGLDNEMTVIVSQAYSFPFLCKHRFFQVWDYHDKGKTVLRPSYLYHRDPYTDKTRYHDGPLDPFVLPNQYDGKSTLLPFCEFHKNMPLYYLPAYSRHSFALPFNTARWLHTGFKDIFDVYKWPDFLYFWNIKPASHWHCGQYKCQVQ